MSQTMQSIQSLSLQLNRAASQCDLNSIVVGPFSPGSSLDMAVSGNGGGLVCTYQQQQQQQQQQQASSTANKLSRLVNKKASRVKEILLQNLGKADKTTDELFKMYEENFFKQQAQAVKLQKEFKSYINALKVSQEADKSLNNCIQQSTNDYQSARHDLVCENLSQMEHLNEDLMEKLRNQVMASISEYLTHFNELRDKIAKRHRKLIDFDSSRRIYELSLANINRKRQLMQQRKQVTPNNNRTTNQLDNNGEQSGTLRSFKSALSLSGANGESHIQSATNQLVDEARLLKLREQYNYCRIMYETINGELHEQLPMVYEKKMKHLLMTLQSYFAIEAQFHSNAGKLFATASDVIDELPMSHLVSVGSGSSSSSSGNNRQVEIVGKTTTTRTEDDEEERGVNYKASGSSGVGSSRADSSLESSSSPDASCCEDEQPAAGKDGSLADGEPAEPEVEGAQQPEDSYQAAAAAASVELESSDSQEAAEEQEEAPEVVEREEEEEPEFEEEQAEAEEEASVGNCEITVHETDLKGDKHEVVVVASEVAQPEVTVDAPEEPAKEPEAEVAKPEAELLYKVKTSYKYLAEDVDELCFEADEIIQVVAFEPSQEQEEGWLMGIREVNGQRGLFPANFTQPI